MKPEIDLSEADSVTALGLKGAVWQAEFAEWTKPEDLRVETAEIITVSAGAYLEKVHFIGANVLYCQRGAFRFTLDNHAPIDLKAGELLIVYARRFVTIEALDATQDNTLRVVIIAGNYANEYIAKHGFYNHLHAPCTYPSASFQRLQDILHQGETTGRDARTEALCLVNSMLRSTWEEIRTTGDTPFYDAVRTIHRHILEGRAQVKDILDALRISRTQIHRIFVRNGFKGAGAFIKDTQAHYALKLLRVSDMKVSEISKKLGFASQSNFTAFIRQHTGKSPLQLRGRSPLPEIRPTTR